MWVKRKRNRIEKLLNCVRLKLFGLLGENEISNLTPNWAKIPFFALRRFESVNDTEGTAKPNDGSFLYQLYYLFLIPNSGYHKSSEKKEFY